MCPFRANHLDDESVRSYLLYAFVVFKDYKEHICWCFSCQIFHLLSEALIGRERHSLFLMKSDFKISFVHSKAKKKGPLETELIWVQQVKDEKRKRLMKNINNLRFRLSKNVKALKAINEFIDDK